MDMNENKRLYRRKDGALASMSLEGGCWRLRTEDGRFTGYRLDGYDEIRTRTRPTRRWRSSPATTP